MDNRNTKRGKAHKYELYEPLSWFWQTAEWDLSEQQLDKHMKKKSRDTWSPRGLVDKVPEETNWTPWIIYFFILLHRDVN